jgi:hypothetical protein
VADRIDGAVDAMQLARGDTRADLGAGEAAGEQLTEAQHPERLGRRLRQQRVRVGLWDDPRVPHPLSILARPSQNSTRLRRLRRLRVPTSPSA